MFACVCVCVRTDLWWFFFFFNLYVFLFEFLPVFVHSFNKNACAPPVFWAVLADGGRGVESGMAPSGGRLWSGEHRPLLAPQPSSVVNLIGKDLRNHLLNARIATESVKCSFQRVSGLTKVICWLRQSWREHWVSCPQNRISASVTLLFWILEETCLLCCSLPLPLKGSKATEWPQFSRAPLAWHPRRGARAVRPATPIVQHAKR